MAIRVERSISDEGDGQKNRIATSSAKCKGNKAGWSFYQGQLLPKGYDDSADYVQDGVSVFGVLLQRINRFDRGQDEQFDCVRSVARLDRWKSTEIIKPYYRTDTVILLTTTYRWSSLF